MTTETRTYRVVVGIDGSEAGRLALAWAARYAAARHGTLRAVTVWGAETPADRPAAREQAVRTLEREVAALHPGLHATVPVAMDVVEGEPGGALAAAADGANLLVIGSHGHSRIMHQLMGSVAEACIRNATTPVVVIPAPESGGRLAGSVPGPVDS